MKHGKWNRKRRGFQKTKVKEGCLVAWGEGRLHSPWEEEGVGGSTGLEDSWQRRGGIGPKDSPETLYLTRDFIGTIVKNL